MGPLRSHPPRSPPPPETTNDPRRRPAHAPIPTRAAAPAAPLAAVPVCQDASSLLYPPTLSWALDSFGPCHRGAKTTRGQLRRPATRPNLDSQPTGVKAPLVGLVSAAARLYLSSAQLHPTEARTARSKISKFSAPPRRVTSARCSNSSGEAHPCGRHVRDVIQPRRRRRGVFFRGSPRVLRAASGMNVCRGVWMFLE